MHLELTHDGHRFASVTVARWLRRLGISRRPDIDPTGASNRVTHLSTSWCPGHMARLVVKKAGRIPDGGGWLVHRHGSGRAKAAGRAKTKGTRVGCVYLHSAVDGFSRLAYTKAVPDETVATTIAFWARDRAFFATHRIARLNQVLIDDGSNYRAKDFTRSVPRSAAKYQRIRPHTPEHNGKVERYNRTLAEELVFAREWTSEAQRAAAIDIWNIHYNYR